MSRRALLGCAALASVTVLAAAVGSAASIQAAEFYAALNQPAWAPSASVFGPVWTVLFIMMAWAACLIALKPGAAAARPSLTLYVVQLALNALWSWLFFRVHSGAWAMVDVVTLLAVIGATALQFKRHCAASCWLMVPYFLWVGFATVLTWSVWQRNPGVL